MKRRKVDRQKNERSCIVCRKFDSKQNLLRIVKNQQEQIKVDQLQIYDGRGCYICKAHNCIQKFTKTKALNRTYKKNIDEQTYIQIQTQLINNIDCTK